MKFCIDCSDPIYEPVLAFDEGEVCECCAIEEIDELKALKQEAFAAGWRQAVEELGR